MRPVGVSMLMKIGPRLPGITRTSTPASRIVFSSRELDASSSATTSAPTRSPSRASASAEYEAPPPSRQPRSSSSTRSRQAAPTTTTAGASSIGPSRGPGWTRLYWPFPRAQRASGRGPRPLPDRGCTSCTSTSFTRATTTSSPTSSSPARRRWSPRSSSTSSSRSAGASWTPSSRPTLVQAIADELERDYDFVPITDDRLTAAVNVSRDEEENFLADLDEPEDGVDYVSILADLKAENDRAN